MACQPRKPRLPEAGRCCNGGNRRGGYHRCVVADLAGDPRNGASSSQPDLRRSGLCARERLALHRSSVRQWQLEGGARIAPAGEVAGESQGDALHRGSCLHRRYATKASFWPSRSEEHTSELQSLMRISYAVFCLKKKKENTQIGTK